MTIEKMCFVKPEDIQAVRITCGECGTASLTPLNQFSSIAAVLSRHCSGCGTETGLRQGTKEWQELVLFTELLGKLSANLKGRAITYSLRIECPAQ